jgi:non-ribosomal peptide synthase protein (TIGR01720 family)
LQEKQVNYIKLTPSHFHLLLQEARHYGAPAGLCLILLGGEMIRPSDLQGWMELSPGTTLANHYGPTETTIGVLTQGIVHAMPTGNELTLEAFRQYPVLGHPIGNHKIYVLDEAGKLCGRGVPGELYIGGPGVSDGYINQPLLTDEKFVVNMIHPDGKLYRTGDRGLWSVSGRVKFLGRADEQLQIHGYRVEPGELAHCVLQYEGIREAVVHVHTSGEDTQLIVYVVAQLFDESQVREYLLQHLPLYMMPSHIVQLDTLPLNANGKVDRQRLPIPVDGAATSAGSTAVIGDYEQLLATAFEQVLGSIAIGREANFFQLGGDSIKAIQIASRLYREGYKIEIRDIFRFPVLSGMAEHIVALHKKSDQSSVTGPITLTPIQWNFFRQELAHPHHYNQSVLLHITEPINAVMLTALLTKLQLHHDALRIVFRNEEQFNNGEDHPVYVAETDLRGNAPALHESLQALQRSFDLATGPLFKAGLVHMDDGSRLLLVAHHLVVDGISWRILLEDLGELYRQYKNGALLQLPLKTDSFQQWSSSLLTYRQSERFTSSVTYWQQQGTKQVPQLVEGQKGRTSGTQTFLLDVDHTTALLTTAHTRYTTEVNDLLLCALDLSLAATFQKEKAWVMLEGHGREDTGTGIDVIRTVGWFTSIYPVLLSSGTQSEAGSAIKQTKEMLRNIPDHGLGYGLLKQEGNSAVTGIAPQVIFNYLGQFDADIRNSGFTIAKEGTGDSSAPGEFIKYPVMISCIVLEGQLRVQIKYDQNYLGDELAVAFCRQYELALRELIRHCLDPVDTITPIHEFGYKGLSVEAIDNIFD